MGIVNVTPDSFSDGGHYADPGAALAQISHLVDAGADWIDIGAESTRPNAQPLSPQEEWSRLAPVLETLAQEPASGRPGLSLDTRHGATAANALALARKGGWGVRMINDVSGGEDLSLLEAVAAHGATLVIMHHLGIPVDPSRTLDPQADALCVIIQWASERLETLATRGIPRQRLLIDPGVGFGKTSAQNWDLIRRSDALVTALPCPVLVGHSRKRFLSDLTDRPAAERDLETQVLGLTLARAGVALVRVHDVAGMRRVLVAAQAAGLLT